VEFMLFSTSASWRTVNWIICTIDRMYERTRPPVDGSMLNLEVTTRIPTVKTSNVPMMSRRVASQRWLA
jgi:hypothetical protein